MPLGRLTALLALVVAIIGELRPAGAEEAADPAFRVIAYVYRGTDIPKISAEKLTHVNYAFATLSPQGELILEQPRATEDLAALNALKRKNSQLKVLLSVGGWGADHFSDAALTPESRARMAKSIVDVIREHRLDGVDLDWEYPGQPGPGIKHRPEDKRNFTLLLEECRRQLDDYDRADGNADGERRNLLTIASASGDYFTHTEMDRLHRHLDWINVMTYDLYNSVAPTTGHHTGLFRSAEFGDADADWAAEGIEQHLAAGIPPEKIVLGAAFYGRAWEGVDPRRHGIGQKYRRYAGEHGYAELVDSYIDKNGYMRGWDDVAKAPYLWNEASRTFVSYDDPESLAAKSDYVRDKKLGGIMFWQYGNDPREQLLDAIFAGARKHK